MNFIGSTVIVIKTKLGWYRIRFLESNIISEEEENDTGTTSKN